MRKIGGNDIGAIFTAFLAICYLVVNRDYPVKGDFGFSAGFFPLILGIALLILSLIWLISSRITDKDFPLRNLIPSRGPIIITLIMIVSSVFFNVLGTILSLFILTGFIWYFYEKSSLRFSLIASLILSLLMYAVFYHGLSVPLPKGLLSFL